MEELVEGIKTHAQANYNSNGWDNNLTTLPAAISYFEANIAKPYDDRRRDVQAEIF